MLRDEDIKLFPHNEKAYKTLVQSLESNPLAFLEHATGTGKSFILLKYLYTKMRQKRTLFISMHDEMFEQLFNEQMPTLGMKKSDFTKLDTMIYPNILKHNMQDIINNYDCIVFDEAHHCGADKWGEKVLELKNLVLSTPGKIMIGATATGTRYLDDYMDVSEEYFNGNTVSRLPISTSILNNLLPAPLYINSLSSSLEYLSKVEKKLSKIPSVPEILTYKNRLDELRNKIETENSIPEFLKKYNVQPGEKYIVFCKDIKDLEAKRKEAENWFKDIGPIKTFTAHSGQKKIKNISEIAEFGKKRNEISLMFAVDIFNEGFHIDGVDGILMFRKTKSPIVYLQQIGRALSFSVRKKQIKIFDFVNNIAQNDVIYSLYKEMITEARKLILEDPDHKELYEEILKKFEIIDETTNVIDELKAIDAYLDENYILKNEIDKSIRLLEEYRYFYPNTDFKDELIKNRLSMTYVNAYRYICHMDEYLSIEQIEALHKLNIDFNKMINLNLETRVGLLKDSKTIHELKEKQRKEFIEEYIRFYQKYNRRPSLSDNKEEMSLYNQYRNYLETLSLSKLKKMIKDFPFSPSVEETILIGNYPEKEIIEEYIAYITKKIEANLPLDATEKKVLKKITKLIPLNNLKLLSVISSIDDINLKIEKAIETISNYKKEVNSNERFENLNAILGEKEVYVAIKTIYKYAKRIINSQFEKLLLLDIKLPHSINMTMEERLKALKGFNSFYELEKGYSSNAANEYLYFVKQNKRRPAFSNNEEKELAENYEAFLKITTRSKIKDACNTLKLYNIELSFYEKVMINDDVPKDELLSFINYIKEKLNNNKKIKPEELKLLRAIERGNYDVDIDLVSYYIKQISSINKLNDLIEKIKDIYSKDLDEKGRQLEINWILREIRDYYKFITKDILTKILSLKIEVPQEFINEVNSLNNYINIYAREREEYLIFIKEFISYIKDNNERPKKGTKLDFKYRDYMSRLSHNRIIALINILIKNGIILTFEEEVMIGKINNEKKDEYIADIEKRIHNDETIDSFEKRVFSKLGKSNVSSKKIKVLKDYEDLEDRIVANLRMSITLNPDLPINYNSVVRISAKNQRYLEEYRLNILAKRLFTDIIKKLKQTKKPLTECLTLSELKMLEEYSDFKFLDNENVLLLDEIKSINIDNKFLSKGLVRKQFIKSYISFINLNGRRPSMVTTDEEELELALNFDDIKNSLTKIELQKIERVIATSTNENEIENFYQNYYSFIITNGRFPCGNSDDPNEVRLNNLYLTLNKTFTKEQSTEVKKLKKLYSKATLQANIRFSKKSQ